MCSRLRLMAGVPSGDSVSVLTTLLGRASCQLQGVTCETLQDPVALKYPDVVLFSQSTLLMARIPTINFIPLDYTTLINEVVEHCLCKATQVRHDFTRRCVIWPLVSPHPPQLQPCSPFPCSAWPSRTGLSAWSPPRPPAGVFAAALPSL